MRWIDVGLRYAAIGIWFLVFTVIGNGVSIFRWGDRNLTHFLAPLLAKGLLRITRIRVRVEGLELLESRFPCIYVGNHQSFMDMAVFGLHFPVRTVGIAKRAIGWIPLFGWIVVAGGNILINRKRHSQAIASLDLALDHLRHRKASIWLFPEGTRNWRSEGLLPFKKGAFRLAVDAQVPIVAVVCSPLAPLFSWRNFRIRPGILNVRILPPVETRGLGHEDVPALLERVRKNMFEALHGLRTEAA